VPALSETVGFRQTLSKITVREVFIFKKLVYHHPFLTRAIIWSRNTPQFYEKRCISLFTVAATTSFGLEADES
jgi:hypothetical protein